MLVGEPYGQLVTCSTPAGVGAATSFWLIATGCDVTVWVGSVTCNDSWQGKQQKQNFVQVAAAVDLQLSAGLCVSSILRASMGWGHMRTSGFSTALGHWAHFMDESRPPLHGDYRT